MGITVHSWREFGGKFFQDERCENFVSKNNRKKKKGEATQAIKAEDLSKMRRNVKGFNPIYEVPKRQTPKRLTKADVLKRLRLIFASRRHVRRLIAGMAHVSMQTCSSSAFAFKIFAKVHPIHALLLFFNIWTSS